MKRASLRVLLCLLVATPLLTLGASPNIGDGPANLRVAVGGDILTTLDYGTPLTIEKAACANGVPWLNVTAAGQTGWVAGQLVSFGDGAPVRGPADAQLELRAEPLGSVQTMLAPGQSLLAIGVSCAQDTPWLHVSSPAGDGWVLGDSVTFQPDQDSATTGGTPNATPSATAAATPTPAAAAGAVPAPAASVPYRAASPEYGIGIFAWGRPDLPDILGRVKALGFTWQKSLIRWRDVESAGKGQYDWQAADALLQASQAAGVRVLARVDFPPAWARADGATNGPPDHYQDYADFLAALVRRYKSGSPYGHLAAIEVWNEPNLAREWGNQPISRQQAADYVRLLALAYAAVKAADPSVLVVTAGLSPTGWNDATARPDDVYLQWLYDAGLKGHYDVLGAHAPGYKAPPEVAPDEAAANPVWGGHRSFTFRRVEDLRAIMVRNGDADKQVAITEFGWTSDPVHPAYAWHAVTEAQKADYLVRAFQWAHQHWAPWIGLMTVWNLPDPSWGPEDEQYWWGIANPDGSPRLAYTALQRARQNGTLP